MLCNALKHTQKGLPSKQTCHERYSKAAAGSSTVKCCVWDANCQLVAKRLVIFKSGRSSQEEEVTFFSNLCHCRKLPYFLLVFYRKIYHFYRHNLTSLQSHNNSRNLRLREGFHYLFMKARRMIITDNNRVQVSWTRARCEIDTLWSGAKWQWYNLLKIWSLI